MISSRNLVGDPAQLNVLIEAIANDRFRATGGPPFEVTAQGTTREEALARLREAIDHRSSEGSVLVPLEFDTRGKSLDGGCRDVPERAIVRRMAGSDSGVPGKEDGHGNGS